MMDSQKKLQITEKKPQKIQYFKKIKDLEPNNYSTLICIVKTVLEPLKTKGTDFVTTITVRDEEKNQIDARIFTKTPRYANFFQENDIIKIQNIKLLKSGVGITGHGSEIEVIANIHQENPKVFVTDSEKIQISKLKQSFTSLHKNPRYLVCDIPMNCFFSFIGLLLDIKEEAPNLTILTMLDFTKSDLISPVIQNAAFTNNMTLIIKIWGEKQASEVKTLEIDQIYSVETLKIGTIEYILEAKISESFYIPLKKIESSDPNHKEILQRQKQYFKEASPAKTQDEFIPNDFKKYDLVKITQIKKNGLYRIRAKSVSNFPFKPVTVNVCDYCRSLESKEVKFKNTVHCKKTKKCNPYSERILKVYFKDSAGSLTVLLKNDLALKYAKNIPLYRFKELDCIILKTRRFNFLVDANWQPQ